MAHVLARALVERLSPVCRERYPTVGYYTVDNKKIINIPVIMQPWIGRQRNLRRARVQCLFGGVVAVVTSLVDTKANRQKKLGTTHHYPSTVIHVITVHSNNGMTGRLFPDRRVTV